jgi:hypothetical protein
MLVFAPQKLVPTGNQGSSLLPTLEEAFTSITVYQDFWEEEM